MCIRCRLFPINGRLTCSLGAARTHHHHRHHRLGSSTLPRGKSESKEGGGGGGEGEGASPPSILSLQLEGAYGQVRARVGRLLQVGGRVGRLRSGKRQSRATIRYTVRQAPG